MNRLLEPGKQRTKRPLCGGEIEISDLYQYSHTHKLTKSGRVSRRYYIIDGGSMETTFAGCSCGANWGVGEFSIDENGYFIDYKY